jgi:nucleoside-diphosphate-sugar epimerase
MTILVTGANGFVGSALCRRLVSEGIPVRAAIRVANRPSPAADTAVCGNIDDATDWSASLAEVGTVVHLAARVHIMKDRQDDPLAEFRRVNRDGTLNLARQAAAAGVRRFLFLSSIKVNGESTRPGKPFSAEDSPAPEDAYGLSKLEAEQGLWQISENSGMEVVVIRPPLVYGPGVKANFERMMHLLARGVPLPLGAVKDNRRSLVALDNLVDLLCLCLSHPRAAGRTFMVADGEDLSTAELLRRLAHALHAPARLLSVSPHILSCAANLLGKKGVARRLLGNLQVDSAETREILDWKPPVTVDQGLQRTVQGWEK